SVQAMFVDDERPATDDDAEVSHYSDYCRALLTEMLRARSRPEDWRRIVPLRFADLDELSRLRALAGRPNRGAAFRAEQRIRSRHSIASLRERGVTGATPRRREWWSERVTDLRALNNVQ